MSVDDVKYKVEAFLSRKEFDAFFDQVGGFLDYLETDEGQKAQKTVTRVVAVSAVRFFYYRKAKKALKRGDFGTALFWLIVWHGYSVVASNAEIERAISHLR